ncbi:hypothetical protein BH20ACI3_BH20ACI3_37620 [soil metagenome]
MKRSIIRVLAAAALLTTTAVLATPTQDGADLFLIGTNPETLLVPVAAFVDARMPEANNRRSSDHFFDFLFRVRVSPG